jgi:hypothetical protein
MNNKFLWDQYSDQPYPMKDKVYKKQMKRKNLGELFPLVFTNLVIFPCAAIYSFFCRSHNRQPSAGFFSLCVNLDKGNTQFELVEELGCTSVQIRVPLADITNLDAYVKFAQTFVNQKILISILQDRTHIDDHILLEKNISLVFAAFDGISNDFQIGNAINRTKWGFFSVAEYLRFYQVVQRVRDVDFPGYELAGPAVIDYEYHFTIRALFNNFKLRFDKVAALLYVDRRGAPENTQMGIYNTTKKIDFLYGLARLSKKVNPRILVTEVNWPISNTAPWAPTSETECVDEQTYAHYMLRFYLLALASGKVESVYWHQLIAPGYGLIDSRDGLRKRSAFFAFKNMLDLLKTSTVQNFTHSNGIYQLTALTESQRIEVLWLNSKVRYPYLTNSLVLDYTGNRITDDVCISSSPIYVIS